MKRILVIGATSAIASACARHWLEKGPCQFVLTGRNEARLATIRDDLKLRGADQVEVMVLDINDHSRHAGLVADAVARLRQLDIVLVAPGSLPDQARCQQDANYARQEFETNATSVILLMEAIAAQLEVQREGKLVVISSVAGDRGRMSNYFYGAAKAAVTAAASGLMMRLQKSGVGVSIVKPGFVRTPMTAGLPLPKKLVATPEQVAATIVSGVDRGCGVIYAPGFWLLIMTIIRLIPTFVFRRLGL